MPSSYTCMGCLREKFLEVKVRRVEKNENSELYKAMTKAGAKYISEGRGKRAFITKEWNQGLN